MSSILRLVSPEGHIGRFPLRRYGCCCGIQRSTADHPSDHHSPWSLQTWCSWRGMLSHWWLLFRFTFPREAAPTHVRYLFVVPHGLAHLVPTGTFLSPYPTGPVDDQAGAVVALIALFSIILIVIYTILRDSLIIHQYFLPLIVISWNSCRLQMDLKGPIPHPLETAAGPPRGSGCALSRNFNFSVYSSDTFWLKT